ncbi:MAG: ribbon-helix-helix domain-containing protein [Lachnospiraceae bacterium]|nr:ribbon-helix-helix domain-containing protein [Lachnospiraceae bacterium]
MAKKKLPKDVDLASNVEVAAGFFTDNPPSEADTDKNEKSTKPQAIEKPSTHKTATNEKKNLGGRPKKDGLKNEQFTLTMHPEMYEKLRILAEEHTRGNFSGLIDEAIKSFCREHNIDLSAIQVSPEILDMYKTKQEKKSKKK